MWRPVTADRAEDGPFSRPSSRSIVSIVSGRSRTGSSIFSIAATTTIQSVGHKLFFAHSSCSRPLLNLLALGRLIFTLTLTFGLVSLLLWCICGPCFLTAPTLAGPGQVATTRVPLWSPSTTNSSQYKQIREAAKSRDKRPRRAERATKKTEKEITTSAAAAVVTMTVTFSFAYSHVV